MTQVDIARWHALLEIVEENGGVRRGLTRAAPARDAVVGRADAERGSLPEPLCELPESAKLKKGLSRLRGSRASGQDGERASRCRSSLRDRR